MDLSPVILAASNYVTKLFSEKLDKHLLFHNAYHTGNVVIAAQEIAVNVGLNPLDFDIVTLAAWFHDTGYTKHYIGHEESSISIAKDFLAEYSLGKEIIDEVCDCIRATCFPQNPQNLMQEVICDADFYHLSYVDYRNYEQSLRLEWEACMDLFYDDREWNMMNVDMLKSHEYFTSYGKSVLQSRKEVHIQRINNSIKEPYKS